MKYWQVQRRTMMCYKRSKSFQLAIIFFLLLAFQIIDYYCGVIIKLQETPYFDESADFPILGDISNYMKELENEGSPSISPYPNHNYTFLMNKAQTCQTSHLQDNKVDDSKVLKSSQSDLVFLVKSAVLNFEKRDVIRRTWGGKSRYRFLQTRTFFLLGNTFDKQVQERISKENYQHRDLIQGDFVDAYYNNTLKTLMGFQFCFKYCDNSDYYLFVDDDYYVSTKNLFIFLKNPSKYEEYAQMPNIEQQRAYTRDLVENGRNCSLAQSI